MRATLKATLHHLQARLVAPEPALLPPWAQETAGSDPGVQQQRQRSQRTRSPSSVANWGLKR